jgi:hypothetical protein
MGLTMRNGLTRNSEDADVKALPRYGTLLIDLETHRAAAMYEVLRSRPRLVEGVVIAEAGPEQAPKPTAVAPPASRIQQDLATPP